LLPNGGSAEAGYGVKHILSLSKIVERLHSLLLYKRFNHHGIELSQLRRQLSKVGTLSQIRHGLLRDVPKLPLISGLRVVRSNHIREILIVLI